jgi:Fe-S-cluster containining protein
MGRALNVLVEQVQARAQTLATAHPEWPCRRGCDACCKRLARVPELTDSEWEWLEAALRALPEAELQACLERAEALTRHVTEHGDEGPIECPLLDAEHAVCRVYAARPLACRSYGFYVHRDHDAWCERVSAHVQDVRAGLVFGNHDALDRELARASTESRSLLAWLARLR